MGTLKIDLLGTNFKIQANENEEYLEKLLVYYKRITEKASKINSIKTPLQISILAGIMLCDELYQEKEKLITFQNLNPELQAQHFSLDEKEIEERTKDMIDKISKVL